MNAMTRLNELVGDMPVSETLVTAIYTPRFGPPPFVPDEEVYIGSDGRAYWFPITD